MAGAESITQVLAESTPGSIELNQVIFSGLNNLVLKVIIGQDLDRRGLLDLGLDTY